MMFHRVKCPFCVATPTPYILHLIGCFNPRVVGCRQAEEAIVKKFTLRLATKCIREVEGPDYLGGLPTIILRGLPSKA